MNFSFSVADLEKAFKDLKDANADHLTNSVFISGMVFIMDEQVKNGNIKKEELYKLGKDIVNFTVSNMCDAVNDVINEK